MKLPMVWIKSAAAALLLLGLASCTPAPIEEQLPETTPAISQPLPPLEVAGWIGPEPPSAERLKGEVVVVDCWAWWCQPCAMKAPDLVRTYIQYRARGVQFIGLTSSPANEQEKMEAFINKYSMHWPNGYGADKLMTKLGVDAIPRVFVVGRDGLIKWDSQSRGTLERAIRNALAEPRPKAEEKAAEVSQHAPRETRR